jgi:hypothetical protein
MHHIFHENVCLHLRRHIRDVQKLKFYLRFKSCIFISDDGLQGPKHVACFEDIIKRLLLLMIIYIYQY